VLAKIAKIVKGDSVSGMQTGSFIAFCFFFVTRAFYYDSGHLGRFADISFEHTCEGACPYGTGIPVTIFESTAPFIVSMFLLPTIICPSPVVQPKHTER
jgi:hypothetical protein